MTQYREKLREYKGLEVFSSPQELPQLHPNAPQSVTPAGELGRAIGGLIVAGLGYVAARIEQASKERRKSKFRAAMLREVRAEDAYIRSFHNSRKGHSDTQVQVNVYGDNNTVNVNPK